MTAPHVVQSSTYPITVFDFSTGRRALSASSSGVGDRHAEQMLEYRNGGDEGCFNASKGYGCILLDCTTCESRCSHQSIATSMDIRLVLNIHHVHSTDGYLASAYVGLGSHPCRRDCEPRQTNPCQDCRHVQSPDSPTYWCDPEYQMDVSELCYIPYYILSPVFCSKNYIYYSC